MIQKGSIQKKRAVAIVLCSVLFYFLSLGILPQSALNKIAVPVSLWTSFSNKPFRLPSRVLQQQWNWRSEQIITRQNEGKLVLSLPGSKTHYTPLAPKLPYISVSIPLQAGESVAYIKTTGIRWRQLSIQASLLESHPDLCTISGEERSAIAFGIHPENCYPSSSFSYTLVYPGDQAECQLKLFPVHVWKDRVWLIDQININIGVSASQKPNLPKNPDVDSVIISPDELMEEAKQLGRIHQKNGYRSLVVPLSHIQKWVQSADPIEIAYMVSYREANKSEVVQIPDYDFKTADKIRAFLTHLLKMGQIDYLTLFGDATYIPPSDYAVSVHNPDPYDRMIPTDLFYMAPEAEGREIPLRIMTGRIPLRSKAEAISFLRKTILHQMSKQQDWSKSVALFGGDMFEDDYYGELQACFMANNGDFGDFAIKKFFETENKYNRDSILQAMSEEDFGFYFMSSHGRGDYLRLPEGYIDTIDIMNQKPKTHFPIWVSNSCLNGAWDTRLSNIRLGTGPSLGIPTSFAESLLFSNGGAIAYIGGARVNYAGMDYNSDLGEMKVYQLYNIDAMLRYFFQSYETKDETLGEVYLKSIQTYIKQDFDNGYEPTIKTLFGYCLLGDPTTSLPDKSASTKSPITLKKKPEVKTGPIDDGSPFVNISEKNHFEIKSQDEIGSVKLCDYIHPQNGVIDENAPECIQTGIYRYTLPSIKKTRFALRIENKQGYEIRYVASGRFNQDIALRHPSIYTHLTKGTPYQFDLPVQNIGLSSVSDIRIEQVTPAEAKYLPSLPNLDPYREYPVKVNVDTSASGTFIWKFTCLSAETEDMDSDDNTIEIQFEIVDSPYQRIGIIGYSWAGLKDNLDETLSLNKVNSYYQNHHLPIEVKSLTNQDLSNIEELSISTLVLYDSGYIPDQVTAQILKKHTSKKGSVLVMGLFDNQFRSMMGYNSNIGFSYHTGDSSFQPFSLMRSKREHFSLDTYQLPCFESYSVAGADLTDSLGKSTYIVGYSEDQMLYLIQNNQWITYSGVLSKLDFKRSEETLSFFADLLHYCTDQSESGLIKKRGNNPP